MAQYLFQGDELWGKAEKSEPDPFQRLLTSEAAFSSCILGVLRQNYIFTLL
ncbi:MAG: hypothetical protein KME15_26080 [Drouetiella hepatica Uher 2000/2452]|jgi:hypothetical protein|uniref:Uncharacterized protein n=1 Tax=Drouetiella hepatica Uher 2000/2452 TaxID=904376 RepID=A0A951US40_9CYAN|nr:hypothetical protein [Drouetiella hepatica Uher 2000/2452]